MAMITSFAKAALLWWIALSLSVIFITFDVACALTETSPRITMQGPAEDAGAPIIRDALNQPCLNVEAAARPRVVNPDIVDHVVSVKNICPRLIKVKVCYFKSEHCNSFDLSGYQRVDTVLGTMTKITAFKYSIYQK
jgi:hypothetical protein